MGALTRRFTTRQFVQLVETLLRGVEDIKKNDG